MIREIINGMQHANFSALILIVGVLQLLVMILQNIRTRRLRRTRRSRRTAKIIRCKDCIHGYQCDKAGQVFSCHHFCHDVEPDDFCSYGLQQHHESKATKLNSSKSADTVSAGVTGTWLYTLRKPGSITCSNCKKDFGDVNLDTFLRLDRCPNCGVKMRYKVKHN